MKINSYGALHLPLNSNPTTKLCKHLASNAIMCQKLSKYFKFVELAIVVVWASMEDERAFSTINFMNL